jgi:GT2 family glycosyltransferase
LSIVTPWHGRPDLIPGYEGAVAGAQVVVVDNASDPATAAALGALVARLGNGSALIRNETNQGFSAANNQGYAAATADTILFLNSDIHGAPRWWEAVVRQVGPGVLMGPSSGSHLVWGWWIGYITGECVAGRRATWERLRDPATGQVWDEGYFFFWEDTDLGFRAAQSGIRLAQPSTADTWVMEHLGGQSRGGLVRLGKQFEQGRARLAAKVERVWREQEARGWPGLSGASGS